jgi:hypothetical protein
MLQHATKLLTATIAHLDMFSFLKVLAQSSTKSALNVLVVVLDAVVEIKMSAHHA